MALRADFRRLVAHKRARLDSVHRATIGQVRSAQPESPIATPTADSPAVPLTENIDETALVLAAIRDDVLPFRDDPHKPPPPLASLGPSPDAGETSYAIHALPDDPRAFFGMPPREPNIDETAAVPALVLDDPLPFAAADGTPPLSKPDPNERDLSGETGFVDIASLGDLDAPLPFQAPASGATPATGARLFGGLTIQQLAAVAVELSLAPDARAAILAHYGLSEETAQRAFDDLRSDRDPVVRGAWNDAYTQYHAYRAHRG